MNELFLKIAKLLEKCEKMFKMFQKSIRTLNYFLGNFTAIFQIFINFLKNNLIQLNAPNYKKIKKKCLNYSQKIRIHFSDADSTNKTFSEFLRIFLHSKLKN